MKQHITKKQLKQLSKEEMKIIVDWSIKKKFCQLIINTNSEKITYLPLLNISQMIEFLGEYKNYGCCLDNGDGVWYVDILDRKLIKPGFDGVIRDYDKWTTHFEELELCDALWEAIKFSFQLDQVEKCLNRTVV